MSSFPIKDQRANLSGFGIGKPEKIEDSCKFKFQIDKEPFLVKYVSNTEWNTAWGIGCFFKIQI